MGHDRPFGYHALKLRTAFVPEGNPDEISTADITTMLGHDAVKIPAVMIPDGSGIPPPGYPDDLVLRYAWDADGGIELLDPEQGGAGSSERAGGPTQGNGEIGDAPTGSPAARAMPPTPALPRTSRYVDPAKTAVAWWRATNALSPPGAPASRGAAGQGDAVTRQDAGPREVAGSSAQDGNIVTGESNPGGLAASALNWVGSAIVPAAKANENIEPSVDLAIAAEILGNQRAAQALRALQEQTVLGQTRLDTALTLRKAAQQAVAQVARGSGPVYGTYVHIAFERAVNALNNPNLSTEVSFRNGREVPPGTSGSIEIDVGLDPRDSPNTVFDLKIGGAQLTQARTQEIQKNCPTEPTFQ